MQLRYRQFGEGKFRLEDAQSSVFRPELREEIAAVRKILEVGM